MEAGTGLKLEFGLGAGYDYPVRIAELPIGTRFACYYNGVAWGIPDYTRCGTVLWIGTGSVEIWWDGHKDPTRCQPDLDVWNLEQEVFNIEKLEHWFNFNTDYGKRLPYSVVPTDLLADTDTTGLEHVYTMAEANASSPAVKALIARWNFQINALRTALEGDDKTKASITMGRIEKCAAEANQLSVQLPELPEAVQGYEPLLEVLTTVKQVADAKKAEKEAQVDRTVAREVAKEKHRVEAGAAKPPRQSTPKKEKVLRPCLDGCGAMVGGNFAMGHDAKLKSLLLKIERGDAPLDLIPEPCLDLVKITRGETVQDRDSEGKPKGDPRPTYTIVAAPVRFPGRPEIALTTRTDD